MGVAWGGKTGLRRERSLPEEERVQVWFSVKWISLLSYSFDYDFWDY